jgi:hypothetical protein
MRDNWLSNRVFSYYDNLVDHCCEAWKKLTDQSWRIMSLGLRQWARGFLSASLGISVRECRVEPLTGRPERESRQQQMHSQEAWFLAQLFG